MRNLIDRCRDKDEQEPNPMKKQKVFTILTKEEA
jgi:hypothetical protein